MTRAVLVNLAAASLALMLGIAGCGGGGGGGAGAVMEAPGPLSLSNVTPASGTNNVPRSVALVLTFSAPLDATTLSASAVSLTGPTGSKPVTPSVAGNVLTVTPTANLLPLTPYTLTIGVGLQGSGGEKLAGPVTTSFTTTDRQWLTAAPIETGDAGTAENPQIAMNAMGTAVAVWRRNDNSVASVWANRYTVDGGWGTAVRIEASAASGATGPTGSPQVAIDALGNATVVWQQSENNIFRIWSNRYVAGTGWSTAVRIETDADVSAAGNEVNPQIALDESGDALAVWERFDIANTVSRIWASRYTSASGWNISVPIDVSAAGAASAHIAFDAGGNALAVWQQSDSAHFPHIWSNRWAAGISSWGTARLIGSDGALQAFNPQIAIDPTGNALAVWTQSDGGTRFDVWANRYMAGADWGTAAQIDNTGGAGPPRIVADSSGNALAVWVLSDNGGATAIRWCRYTPGSGWSPAALIEPADANGVDNPQIAMNANGIAIAVWEHFDGMHTNARSSRYTPGIGWSVAVYASNAGDVLQPAIAVDPTGNALGVWQDFDSSNTSRMWSNRFE